MSPETTATPELALADEAGNEIRTEFLLKEYDVLKELYLQAHADTQSIFNFYLTLITAVSGGLVFILQNGPEAIADIGPDILVNSYIVFMIVFGATTILSLSVRYGNLGRYGQAIDELRRFVARENDIPLPPHYDSFLARKTTGASYPHRTTVGLPSWLRWIYPTGAYHFFVAVVSSVSLAIAGHRLGMGMPVPIAIFVGAFILFNLLARRVIWHHVTRSTVSVDVHR